MAAERQELARNANVHQGRIDFTSYQRYSQVILLLHLLFFLQTCVDLYSLKIIPENNELTLSIHF